MMTSSIADSDPSKSLKRSMCLDVLMMWYMEGVIGYVKEGIEGGSLGREGWSMRMNEGGRDRGREG